MPDEGKIVLVLTRDQAHIVANLLSEKWQELDVRNRWEPWSEDVLAKQQAYESVEQVLRMALG